MRKSYFITFEGGEGSGKSTQLLLLAEWLKTRNCEVDVTREPGGTTFGTEIRRLLLTKNSETIFPMAELFLYAADRAQHVEQSLQPALEQGRWVICDRYTDSTVAYQGYGRGLDLSDIEKLNQLAIRGLKPDLTFLLDCPVELGLQRSQKRLAQEQSFEDRFESEALEFHQKVRNGFLELARLEPQRFVVVDASLAKEEVQQFIVQHLQKQGLC